MIGAFVALLLLLELPSAFACDSLAYGSIAYGPQCNNSKIIPDCSWIEANSGLICSSNSSTDVVINGEGCSLAFNGCVYSDAEVWGADNFCCLPASAGPQVLSAPQVLSGRRAQELSASGSVSGSGSGSGSVSFSPRPSTSPVVSSSILRSVTPTGSCAYRVYNAATDFSSVQGSRGWYYGYYNPDDVFTQFSHYGYATGSLGSVNSWNYNAASNGNIGALMIMPNGAGSCNTNTYGDVAPVLRWYNPVGSCFQDVTVSVYINHASPSGGIIAGLTINGATVYANSAGGALTYNGAFNHYGVRSVELTIGPRNSICDYGQTSYSLNIAPMGPSFTVLPSVTVSASSKGSVSPSRTSTNSVSNSLSRSPTLTRSVSRSPSNSGSQSYSATATATEFYTGVWSDLGQYNYAQGDISNLGAMTIKRCQVNCWQNPLCGLIVVTSPCNTVDLNSSAVYTTVCEQCWLKLTSGWSVSADSVSRSIMLYDRVYPPTGTSLVSRSVTVSPKATTSVIGWSAYNMCSASGTTVALPFVGSGVGLITNAAGANYIDSANCVFTVGGGSSSSRFSVQITSFNTEPCCDFLTIYNDVGATVYRSSGTVAVGTELSFLGTSYLRLVFTTDGSVTMSGISFSVTLVSVPASVSASVTGQLSVSPSERSTRSNSRSLSVSASSSITASPVKTGQATSSIGSTLSRVGSLSSSGSVSASASPSNSALDSATASASASLSNSPLGSATASASASSSNSAFGSTSSSWSPLITLSPSPSYSPSASNSASSSESSPVTASPSWSIGPTHTSSSTKSPADSACSTVSAAYTHSVFGSVTVCPSQSATPTMSGSASWSVQGSATPSMSASNLKPAGPPPALPANLSSLSLTALSGLFNDMANYPPTLIGDNLQKLGFAALANSPGGEFGISTSVFSVKIKSLASASAPAGGPNKTASVPLSVGKTDISMPLIGGASAASAIVWTSDPYDSGVAPDSSVISLNVLDSKGSKVSVKNSSAPIIISMNLNPVSGDPRFAPLPSYLADCTAGAIYVKEGREFTDASEIVNITGVGRWSVPCLLGDKRSVNCSAGDTVLRYTCPPLIFTPKCQYWDSVSNGWSTDGCVPTFSNATLMVCSCTHLTDFSSRINAVVAAQQTIIANAASVYSLEGLLRFAQWYGTFGGIALLAMILGYIAVSIDKRGTRAYVAELLHNESINLFLAHNPDVPVFSYDPASKYSKARTAAYAFASKKKKALPAVTVPQGQGQEPVKRMSCFNRIFLQHSRLQFLFKYDPRLSRLFRLLFLFVLQFHSLFVTAFMYNFTYNGQPMMWYDTIILSLITTALNMPVIRFVMYQMNAIGMKEFQAQFPLLFEEYERRLDFELHAMYYIFKKPSDVNGDNDDGSAEAAANELDFMDDEDSSIFDVIALFLCNRSKPPSRTDALIGLSHKDAMRIMVNIVKEPYPYYEQYGVGWQNAPCHTWQGALFIACCSGWLGWCLNYLLLFASSHAVEVGAGIMTSYATSEISTIFLVQPMTIMLSTAVYYLVKRYEKVLPAFIVGFFINRKIKSIPSIFYFSDPWNKKSKSPFTSEFAYNLFVHCPAAASGVNEMAYASIAALSENIDGSEVNRLSEVLILYRRVLAVWDEIKRVETGVPVVTATPANKLSLRNPSFTPNKVLTPTTVRSSGSSSRSSPTQAVAQPSPGQAIDTPSA